jgi:DNA-binding SARP family transcriptional activator
MQVRLLGPVEVDLDGTPVRLRGGRERALLARLALSAGRVIGSDRLVEDLWGAEVIDGAVPALQVYVSRLRGALRAAGADNVLHSRPAGYALEIGEDVVDASVFARLATEGRALLADGAPAEAAAALRDALALWRGPALADIGDVPFAANERVRLEEERLAALEARIEADLAVGAHRNLVGELETLTADHPFRERLWAFRMLALYREGRQADALAVHEQLRTLLRDELGLDPSPDVRRVAEAILRQEPFLDLPATAQRPAPAPQGPRASTPLPAWATPTASFVGRVQELDRLNLLGRGAAARVAFVAGEPGVGKTALVVRLANTLHEKGVTVLAGRCEESIALPYQPIVEALREFVAHHRPEDLPTLLGEHAGEFARVLPELPELCPSLPPPLRSDPETERYRLFEAVATWLHLNVGGAGLLLIIDDVQWATKPTLLLLRHLVRSARGANLALVATYRDTELAPGDPLRDLIGELRAQGLAEHLALEGLDAADVAEYLHRATGAATAAEDRLTRSIWAESGGNPLYLTQLSSGLLETGALVIADDGRWDLPAGFGDSAVPAVLRDVLHRRVDRLSEATRRLLTAGAVAGTEFTPAVAGRVAGLDDNAALDAVDEAIAAHLVHEVPGAAARCRFTHALVRHYLYDAMSMARRSNAHRAMRTTLENAATGEDRLPALAYHAARCVETAEDAAVAAEYLRQIGDRALQQLADHEAVDAYTQALDLWDRAGVTDDVGRLRTQLALGEAWRRIGDPRSRECLLDTAAAAQRVGEVGILVEAALANGRGNVYSVAIGIDAERVATLEAALDALGPEPEGPQGPAQRARLLAGLGLELAWHPQRERRIALSDEAVDLARAHGDPATLAAALLARDYTIASPANTTERLATTAEILDLADATGDPVIRSRALLLRYRAAMELAMIDEAERCLQANEELVAGLNQPTLAWPIRLQRAGLTLLRGDLEGGDAAWSAACEYGAAIGQPDAATYLWTGQVGIRLEQGRAGEMERETQERIATRPLAVAQAFLLTILDAQDRLDTLRAQFADLAAAGFSAPFDFLWLRFQCDCASACRRGGGTAAAEVLYRNLEPYADQLVTLIFGSVVTGSVSHYLGLLAAQLGRYDDAAAHFSAAAQVHERIGAPLWAERTRREWDRALEEARTRRSARNRPSARNR